MEDQLVTFETAKMAKDKGLIFPMGLNKTYWSQDGSKKVTYHDYSFKELKKCVEAVSQSLLQKWLREVHNITPVIRRHSNVYNILEMLLYDKEDDINLPILPEGLEWQDFSEYEDAIEVFLLEALKDER